MGMSCVRGTLRDGSWARLGVPGMGRSLRKGLRSCMEKSLGREVRRSLQPLLRRTLMILRRQAVAVRGIPLQETLVFILLLTSPGKRLTSCAGAAGGQMLLSLRWE